MRPRNSAVALAAALALALPAHAQKLAAVDAWGVGWIGANEGAVPADFWANTDAGTLAPVLAAIQPRDLSPAANALLHRVMASRTKGPAGIADLTPERLRLLEQMGELSHAADLRKRFPATDWGKTGARASAELSLLKGDRDAACSATKGTPATDADWLPLRAVCAALDGNMDAANLAAEQVARTNEPLGVWLLSALPAIASPDMKKPDARFTTPLEATVSVAAKLPNPATPVAAASAEIAEAVASDTNTTAEQRRWAMRAAFGAGKLTATEAVEILALKTEGRPDALALALAASTAKDAKPEARATAYVAALRSAETLADARLITGVLAGPIKALPKNDATLSYAEPFARAALLAGDTKQASEWRKHMGTLPKDKLDAWSAARIDLMLSFAGAAGDKPAAILDRMLAAAPYPAPPTTPPTPAPKTSTTADQQLSIRRIENTRALFLSAGMARDLSATQRATLSAQRTAGRGVSDAAIARVTSAARQNADAEAALVVLTQLGPDVSAISFAGLSDLLAQMLVIGLDDDANAIALEALQVWKAF